MKKVLLAIIFLLVAGCVTSIKYVPYRELVTIPTPPKVVVMDNGRYDKSKYPETNWVKEPTVDLKNGRAYWSFEDIEKISKGLTEWPQWAVSVETIINDYNRKSTVQTRLKETNKSWWEFWK